MGNMERIFDHQLPPQDATTTRITKEGQGVLVLWAIMFMTTILLLVAMGIVLNDMNAKINQYKDQLEERQIDTRHQQ